MPPEPVNTDSEDEDSEDEDSEDEFHQDPKSVRCFKPVFRETQVYYDYCSGSDTDTDSESGFSTDSDPVSDHDMQVRSLLLPNRYSKPLPLTPQI